MVALRELITMASQGSRFCTIKEAVVDFFDRKISERLLYDLFHAHEIEGVQVEGKILLFRASVAEYICRMSSLRDLPTVQPKEPSPQPQPPPKGKVPKGGFRHFTS
jgi:hypothetical protein